MLPQAPPLTALLIGSLSYLKSPLPQPHHTPLAHLSTPPRRRGELPVHCCGFSPGLFEVTGISCAPPPGPLSLQIVETSFLIPESAGRAGSQNGRPREVPRPVLLASPAFSPAPLSRALGSSGAALARQRRGTHPSNQNHTWDTWTFPCNDSTLRYWGEATGPLHGFTWAYSLASEQCRN